MMNFDTAHRCPKECGPDYGDATGWFDAQGLAPLRQPNHHIGSR